MKRRRRNVFYAKTSLISPPLGRKTLNDSKVGLEIWKFLYIHTIYRIQNADS